MEDQERIPPSTEVEEPENLEVEEDLAEEETVDEDVDEAPVDDDEEKSLDERLDEYFANYESEEQDEQEEQEEVAEDDEGEGEPASVEAPPTPEPSPQNAELEMYRRLFADADALAKESLYGNMIEMIAEAKGMSVEEYRDSLGVSEPPKQEESLSTQETISKTLALSMKMKEDIDAINAKFPDAKISSLEDIKNSSKYVALRDEGASPEEAYAQAIQPKVDGKKHMTATASKTTPSRGAQMTAYEKKVARDLFGDTMTDADIQKLYRRVSK